MPQDIQQPEMETLKYARKATCIVNRRSQFEIRKEQKRNHAIKKFNKKAEGLDYDNYTVAKPIDYEDLDGVEKEDLPTDSNWKRFWDQNCYKFQKRNLKIIPI